MTFRAWFSSLRRSLTHRRQIEHDLDDEVRATFDLLVDEKVAAGLPRSVARRAAALELGGIEQIKEQVRSNRTGSALDIVARDVRFAARVLAKSPGFTAAAVLTLAVAIGLNTTIFSFVYAVIKPLPFDDLPRLMTLYVIDQRNGERGVSRQNYLDFKERNTVFEELTAEGFTSVNLAGDEADPERVAASVVAANYFATLRVSPLLGRGFLPDEDRTEGARLVAVLSYGLWQSRFGGDRAIVGKDIALNNRPFTVVGVMPPWFRGIEQIGGPALWVPIMTYPVTTTGQTLQGLSSTRARGYDWFMVTGRLKPDVTPRQADANVKAIARQLEEAYPNDNGGRSAGVRPIGFSPNEQRSVFTSAGMLMTVVGLVLFIACTNVATLMLSRAMVRQREMAIRQALGASRGRLVRQLLTEGMLLAVVSGLAGLLIARWGQSVLWSYRPPGIGAGDIEIGLNLQELAFAAVVSLGTCVLFALVPAIRASRPDLVPELKGSTSRISGIGRTFNLRDVFIATQVALSLMALVSAGLFIRSLQTVQRIDPGFDFTTLAALRFELGAQGYGENQGREFQRRAIERATAVAGVESAILADLVPLFGGAVTRTVFTEGEDLADRRNGRIVPTGIVGAGYFNTLGIPVVRGRAFTDRDAADAPLVAIVNERLASLLWPGGDGLGKRVKMFNTDFAQVVGIVRNAKHQSLGDEPPPILYRPLAQVYQSNVALIVRGKNPAASIATVRSLIQQLDPRLPITNASTLSDVVYTSLWTPRMAAWLLTLLAMVSLTLAAIGIYGAMAYTVTQRTRELGIRVALGADRGAVVRLVLGRGFRLALGGLGVGLAASLAASRLIANLLYRSPFDPITFVVVPLILMIAVLMASYLPARRATRIPATTALRSEA